MAYNKTSEERKCALGILVIGYGFNKSQQEFSFLYRLEMNCQINIESTNRTLVLQANIQCNIISRNDREDDYMDKLPHNIAYHFRIYPNREQEVLLAKTFGCCRFLYNQMLGDKIREYEASKKMLRNTPAMYKKAYAFLKEVDSLALANVHRAWLSAIWFKIATNRSNKVCLR